MLGALRVPLAARAASRLPTVNAFHATSVNRPIRRTRPNPRFPLTLEMIWEKLRIMRARGETPGTATHHALYSVLDHFLGEPWLHDHVLYGCRRPGYLAMNPTTGADGYGIDKVHTQRVLQLAEALFNLQGVPGLGQCIDRLFNGQIESTMAELDFGMFMRIQGTDFQYVTPSGVKRQDYDVELLYPDGLTACGDIKCKVDGSAFKKQGLLSTLKKARTQLPSDRPGIAFVKVPQDWVDRETGSLGLGEDVGDLLDEFFKSTARVVLVAIYSKLTTDLPNGTTISYVCRQFENRSSRFSREESWGLFDVARQKPSWINLSAALRL